jgi:hypothetical protein
LTVEFVVQTADLRQATSQLKANRGEHSDTDFVDILVSECAATFRAIGTETEVPVNGKHPGSVRVPLRIVNALNRAVRTFKTKELDFRCEPGAIKVGTFSVKHPDIELGIIPDQRWSLPIDVSVLDTLAFATILSADQIVEEGMRARVEDARDACTAAVATALAALQPLGITEPQLRSLIDAHVNDAAKQLRKSLSRS